MKSKIKNQKGFTIVELLVSVTIFTIIVFFSLGSVVIIFSSNRKSESIRSAIDNANFALEVMTREIKFGSGFDSTIGLKFENATGETITFSKEGNQIFKKIGTGSSLPITSPTYNVDTMNIKLNNTDTQPLITIFIKGIAMPGSKEPTSFSLQTTISPRQLKF